MRCPAKKKNGVKIQIPEIESMLKMKVLKEANRLKMLHDSNGSPSAILVTMGSATQSQSSTMQEGTIIRP